MSGPIEIILIFAAVGYVLLRRLVGEPAEGKRMLLVPAVLVAAGLTDLAQVAQSPASIWFLIGTTAVSVVLGLLRGASVRVFEQGGIVFMRYTMTTVILWIVNIAIKFGAGFVLGLVDPQAERATSNGLMLTFGAGMLLEGLAVLAQAVRMRGRIVWEQGKDGRPHRNSPVLDGLQERARATDRTPGDE